VRDEDSVEFRLAAALASAGMRPRMSPVELRGKQWWAWAKPNSKVETWVETASLESNLLELLRRRDIEAQQGTARERFLDAARVGIGRPRVWARLDDVADFIEGRVDDRRLEALLRGLALIHWPMVPEPRAARDERVLPPSAFTLLALAREGTMPGTDQRFPDTPGLLPRAAAGRLADATTLAVQRLHAAGLTFSATKVSGSPTRSRRIAAALAFPLADTTLELLRARTFPRFRPEGEDDSDDTTNDTREDLHP
jgi:CRISPR-associated protein Csx17